MWETLSDHLARRGDVYFLMLLCLAGLILVYRICKAAIRRLREDTLKRRTLVSTTDEDPTEPWRDAQAHADQQRRLLSEAADQNPEHAAGILRRWMSAP